MRVVSLLPGWTEWMAEFGVLHLLVGRSHLCDFPPPILNLPSVTIAHPSGRSGPEEGKPHLQVDLNLLESLQPDVILTHLSPASFSELRSRPDVVSPEASTFRQVLTAALALGQRLGFARQAIEAIAERERKLKLFRDCLGLSSRTEPRSQPSVLCLESTEPLVSAGFWIPGLVELAGGRTVCSLEGEPSRTVSPEEIQSSNPDVIAVLTDAFPGENATWRRFTDSREWKGLAAVQNGRIYVINRRSCFSRPGPRLYEGIELLGAALHPGIAPFEHVEMPGLAP